MSKKTRFNEDDDLFEEILSLNNNNIIKNNSVRKREQKEEIRHNIIKCEIEKLKTKLNFDDHSVPLNELCDRLGTNHETGLSESQAKHKLVVDGPNLITTSHKQRECLRFLKNMFGWFNLMLWLGSVLCFIMYAIHSSGSDELQAHDNIYLGSALVVVVFISGLFSYYQDLKSAFLMEAYKNLIPRSVTVIRSAVKVSRPVETLVEGDLIEVKDGDQIPADIRIVESKGFKIDASLLTGETKILSLTSVCTDSNPLDTRNLAFFPANCVSGSARGIVIRTGNRNVLKDVTLLSTSLLTEKLAPLSKDLHQFINIILCVSLFFGFMFAQTAYTIGYTYLDTIIFFIALIVAQVPEGLLPTVTVMLTLTAKRMASKNCLVKNLKAVETLGLTSIICTDKTGTLTQNKMTVSHVWCDQSIVDSESLIRIEDGRKANIESNAWKELIKVCCLCNEADFDDDLTNVSPLKRQTVGDSTDVAILKYMEIISSGVEDYRKEWTKVFELPFNSINMYSLTVNAKSGGFWVCMKGAPELILERCSVIISGHKDVNLDSYIRNKILKAIDFFGNLGERVIGLCDKFLPENKYPPNYDFDFDAQNFPTTGLRFIGLISMIDPPRPSVPEAILKCQSAGVKVIMITGDHELTAKSFAKCTGMMKSQTRQEIADQLNVDIVDVSSKLVKAAVIHGDRLKHFTNSDLEEVIATYEELVFARTTHQQKLMIVEACQRLGSIVAVTGNSVNDASALKEADIGIAMGVAGSHTSKHAADMILLNDDFASIVACIEEGRVVFDNLKKSICYTLSSKIPEMTPFVMFFTLDIPLPLGALTILCIDFGTDMVPAVSLAYERAESNIMGYRLKDYNIDKLVTQRLISLSYGQMGMFQMCSGFFTYLVIMCENGFLPNRLYNLRIEWDSKAINDLADSYGQEWTYTERKTLEYTCHTAFFASVVITKLSALICCKTRRLSIFQQGMNNRALIFAMVFELALAMFLSYCPHLDVAINMYPLKPLWWLCAVPFALALFCYDELRRFIMRRFPGGWIEKETYY